RHTSIRVILALTACKDFELEQLDVKTAFLHGNLEEVIYMRQPPGYEQGNKACLLKKSLYGLKQSPRQWYRRFNEYMLSNGFKRSSYDICVYYRSYAPGEYIYLLLYVDDMLIACKSKAEIGSTKSLLKREFDMKDLGEAKKILGMEIIRDWSRKILRVSQSRYISKILNNFRIDNGKSVQMPLVGHFKLSLKECPTRDCDVERINYAKDSDKGRSINGYAFLVQGCVVSWKATLQHVVALSTTEAEYMALTEAVKEAIWLRGLLEELGVELNRVTVNCDNQGAIHLSRNHVFHERTKHINVRYHFIREVLEAKTVEVLKVDTEHNAADALTKVGLLEELGVELNRVTDNCDNQGAIYLSRNHVFHERTKHFNVRYHFIREVLEAKTVEVLKVLSYDESKSRRVSERTFMTLFGQDYETFTSTMFLYYFMDYDNEMIKNIFAEYTGIKVKQFRETLLLHMGNVKKSVAERTRHKKQYDRRMKERQMQSRERTYITHVVDTDIRSVNNQNPSVEVHLTAQHNVFANEQQHTDQFEPSYDTYLLEKVDSNTTSDSTNMCHRGGEIDQDTEQDQTKFAKPSILGKPVLQPLRNQSVVRQPTAFRSERPKFSKPRFTSQVDVNNVLSKPVTPYYFPKVREYVFVKPNNVIASGSSRNSSKESYGLNDMAYNYYLKEVKKKTQDKIMNLKPSVMHTTSLQNTTNGYKPKPRSNNQTFRSLPVPKSSRGILNGLIPQPPSPTPIVPPIKNDWDTLFYTMFDEYFNPSPSIAQPVLVAAVHEPIVSTSTPSSTRIDQDAPSTSTSQTIKEVQSHVIPTSVEEDDHELHEFEQLEIWELVPRPDQVMIVTLKWIYKVGMQSMSLETLKKMVDETEELWWLYTSSLLNAACKKALNLLKKELLIRGRLWKLLKEEEACLTIKFNYFPKVQVKDMVLFQRFPISQRTILVAQVAYFRNLIMKFKMYQLMSLTLSPAKLELQSMVDVLIHQEDPAI
nr:retrotransposon protein, putative, Ty1-copia subclass [Tanacetum cinerariifolium]